MKTEPNNRNAFIRLYGEFTGVRLPVMGMREPDRASPALIMVPGENYIFYVNTNLGVGGLVATDGISNYNLNPSISTFAYTGGSHSIIDVIVPFGPPDGVYICNIGGYQSNPIEIIHDVDEANQRSAYFEISHNSILGDFYYPYAGSGFKQKVRMRCSLKDHQPDSDFSNYQQTNDGKMQSLAGTIKEYVTFETADFSKDDHGAAHYLSLHDNIKVNGREYHRKDSSPYRVSANMDTPLYSGEFGLYDSQATVLLRC